MKMTIRFYAHNLSLLGDYTVLSIHRKAINFINDQGKLVSIHPSIRYMTPFGLTVKATDFQHLYNTLIPNQPVFYQNNQLIINHYDQILLTGKTINTSLQPSNISITNQNYLLNFNISSSGYNQTGVLGLITNFLTKPTKDNVNSMIHAIGFGQGLTPSFDDSLIGMLAILYLIPNKYPYINLLLSHLTPAFLQKRTTALSTNFLLSALNGVVSYPFYHFLYKLAVSETNFPFALSNFLNYGQSSGSDTLLGIKITLQTLQREKI